MVSACVIRYSPEPGLENYLSEQPCSATFTGVLNTTALVICRREYVQEMYCCCGPCRLRIIRGCGAGCKNRYRYRFQDHGSRQLEDDSVFRLGYGIVVWTGL